MSLQILQSYSAVRNNGVGAPFGATGGVSPYNFSIIPGGAGGSINSASGVYIAPIGSTGTDIVVVSDSSSPTQSSSASLAILSPIELVCDIISNQLNLESDQVYLYQQKYTVPADSRLYVSVGIDRIKHFGNKPSYSGSSSIAVQSVNLQMGLSIDVFSRSLSPIYSMDLIAMALSSPYAEQQMELNSFFVAPLSESIINISGIDGPAIPYHFQMRCNLQYFSTINSSVDYFSSFGSPSIVSNP